MKQLSRDVSTSEVSGEGAGDQLRSHRRLEITVEREVISVVAWPQSFPASCPDCGREVTMFAAEEAAAKMGSSTRAVYRWVEEKRLHFIESGSGKLFICSESLNAFVRSKQISSGESR